MVSIKGVGARLSANLFLQLCDSISWTEDRTALVGLSGQALGAAIVDARTKASQTIRDKLDEVFERIALIAKAPNQIAFWAGVGQATETVQALEALSSFHDRVLWLYLNDPAGLERVEAVLEFATHAQRGWRGYHLDKAFSRRWTPEDLDPALLNRVVSEAVQAEEGAARRVEIEQFAVPATADGWDGAHAFFFNIHLPDRSESAEEWENQSRITRARTPDRRIDLLISPSAKTIEAVAGTSIAAGLLEAVVQDVAVKTLGLAGALTPFRRRRYSLEALRNRPKFRTHEEHGIRKVRVTKLVVAAGTGTVTYWGHAREPGDVYDVIAGAPGRSIGTRRILAATLRVTFAPTGKPRRERHLSFDISLPNASSLRERQRLDQIVIGTYLREWGLLDPEEVARQELLGIADLAELLETLHDCSISRADAEDRFGGGMGWLKSSGILASEPATGDIICYACSPPHPVSPVEDPGTGQVKHVCARAGDIQPDPSDTEMFSASRSAFARELARTLDADTSIFREVRAGQFWCLGVVPTPRPWTAFLGFDLQNPDVLGQAHLELEGPIGKEPGLLISAPTMPRQMKLPHGHRLVWFSDILRLTPAGLVVVPGVERALAGKAPARRRGRKSRKPEGLKMLRFRREHGLSDPDPENETKAIMKALEREYPGEIPSFKEVRYGWFKDEFG